MRRSRERLVEVLFGDAPRTRDWKQREGERICRQRNLTHELWAG